MNHLQAVKVEIDPEVLEVAVGSFSSEQKLPLEVVSVTSLSSEQKLPLHVVSVKSLSSGQKSMMLWYGCSL